MPGPQADTALGSQGRSPFGSMVRSCLATSPPQCVADVSAKVVMDSSCSLEAGSRSVQLTKVDAYVRKVDVLHTLNVALMALRDCTLTVQGINNVVCLVDQLQSYMPHFFPVGHSGEGTGVVNCFSRLTKTPCMMRAGARLIVVLSIQ